MRPALYAWLGFADLRKWLVPRPPPRRYKPRPQIFLHCNKPRPSPMSHTIAAASGGSTAAHDGGDAPVKAGFWALTLGCIGVVYGDIGTSPLYAVRELVLAAVGPASAVSEPVVLGILSLIIWALLVGGHRQIRAHPAACRQPRRGRHAGADGARLARARRQPRRRHRHPARHHQRRAVLRRRHHHAGAVGALRDRRLEGGAIRNRRRHRLPRRPGSGGSHGRACRAGRRPRAGRAGTCTRARTSPPTPGCRR